jgi:hypothetical protein
MAFKRKKSSKTLYAALILLVILVVALAAVLYVVAYPPPKPVTVGVNVGDTFTYNITSTSTLIGLDAEELPGFFQYNQTEYYRITITGITGTNVSMNTLWRFKNGTEVIGTQLLDVATGKKVDINGFWALYPSNLNVGDLLRPKGFDGLTVNRTDTRNFADSTRYDNYWFIENQFYNVNDPTQSTMRYDYTGGTFDQITGMLLTLTNYQEYNNPAQKATITWNLFDSSVWRVN